MVLSFLSLNCYFKVVVYICVHANKLNQTCCWPIASQHNKVAVTQPEKIDIVQTFSFVVNVSCIATVFVFAHISEAAKT